MHRELSRLPGSRLALAAFALSLAIAADGRAAGPQRWLVAPAGLCAEAPHREPCAGGACASQAAPARSRFDPTDVAATTRRAGVAPPGAQAFSGPGSCADPSTPCGGSSEPTRVAGNPPPAATPPPGAPSPAGPPPAALPTPPAPPPAPPAPTPPTVVESPGGPGTLPGLP
jgi:hypothetical protein